MKRDSSGSGCRWLKPLAIAGISAAGLAVATLAAAATVVAIFARTVVTPPQRRGEDARILGTEKVVVAGEKESITVVELEAGPDTVLDGNYGLWFGNDAGHARLGEIVGRTEATVKRRLIQLDFGDLSSAQRGRWSGWYYLGPWEFELPYENVTITTPVGPAPAWWVPGPAESTRWVISVHGRAVRRQECLRSIPVVHSAGFHNLLVSYRNDGEAPESGDGRYGLGDTEWQDVAAAILFARDHGASEIVLMGWSMGGAISMQTAMRAELRHLISGVVLESPAVDWRDILHFQGEGYGFPRALNSAVLHTLGSRWGRGITGLHAAIDFERLDLVSRAALLNVPILILHSADDGYVPATGSRELAAARPDLVSYEEFTTARHTKLWNYDPQRWNAVIGDWLRTVPSADVRSRR